MMNLDFSEKVVCITGAAGGIGKSAARSFFKTGAKLVLIDNNYDELKLLGQEMNGSLFFAMDITNNQLVKNIFSQVARKLNTVDILVNCAGVTSPKPFLECTEEDWDFIVDINLKGTFNTCNVVFPHMVSKRYGKIVNIASIAGKLGGGFVGTAIYAASKAGVIGLTKGLALEGGPYNINVNAVCPGPTNTAMLASLTDEKRQLLLNGIPLRRFGEPADIANTIVFLSSDLARHITGEICDVDGGVTRDN
jgi:3-oxoacyl-[acyl-carrier protein] reductase